MGPSIDKDGERRMSWRPVMRRLLVLIGLAMLVFVIWMIPVLLLHSGPPPVK